MIFSTHKSKQGITLVEAVVSVGILSMAVIGPFVLASSALKASRDSRIEAEATHYAEEGIELIHNMRDNNSAIDPTGTNSSGAHNQWYHGAGGAGQGVDLSPCAGLNGCIVNVKKWDNVNGGWLRGSGNAVDACSASPCSGASGGNIYIDSVTGLAQSTLTPPGGTWVPSTFTRTIYITEIDNPGNPLRQVRVKSVVTYVASRGAIRSVSIVDDLNNWFPNLQ